MKTFPKIVIVIMAVMLVSFGFQEKWIKAGSHPNSYEMVPAKDATRESTEIMTIRSTEEDIPGFGTLLQTASADKYKGKRLRMSADMRTKDASRAAFWLRADQRGGKGMLLLDNMNERPITGTTEWKRYEIEMDVPEEATHIIYGAMLTSTGQIWFDNVRLETVDKAVPAKGK